MRLRLLCIGVSLALAVGCNVLDGPDEGSSDPFETRRSGLITLCEKDVTYPDGSRGYENRFSFDIDGNGTDMYAAGAPFMPSAGLTKAGRAYVYLRDLGGTNAFGEAGLLEAEIPDAYSHFGHNVAVWDRWIAVGAPRSDRAGVFWGGHVEIFERTSSNPPTFIRHAVIEPAAPGNQARFGYNISMSDNFLAVGSPGDDSMTTDGHFYIYERSGSVWNELLDYSPGTPEYQFAREVDIADGVAAVTSKLGTAGSVTGVRMRIFEYDGSAWNLTKTIDLPGSQRVEPIVGEDGGFVFNGSWEDDEVSVLRSTGTDWVQDPTITSTLNVFGGGIYFKDPFLYVGAPDTPGTICVFERDTMSTTFSATEEGCYTEPAGRGGLANDFTVIGNEIFGITRFNSDLATATARIGPANPEVCNLLDDNCDGTVDEAASDCLAGESCHVGQCFVDCSTDMDCGAMPGDLCYVDDNRCDDPVDPCSRVTCTTGTMCYGGSCFATCTSDLECDPLNEVCYDAQFCNSNTDPCADVQCLLNEVCHGGNCFPFCVDDADCTPPAICFENRCATDICENVLCGTSEVCIGGDCFLSCMMDSDCPMGESCVDGGCTDDPCASVTCASGQTCYGGSCFEDCDDDGDCTPPELCWTDRCAVDPCDGFTCPSGQSCYQGSCFEDCVDNADCSPPEICFDNRCSADVCAGVTCPSDQVCSGGSCFDPCFNNGDCTMPQLCWDKRCTVDPCGGIQCADGQTCHAGSCFDDCSATDPCLNPDSICYQNRCVSKDDPYCDGVICADGQGCYIGECFDVCDDVTDCDPNHICYADVCLADDCSATTCPSGLDCYQGACFETCSVDGDCPGSKSCFEGRCSQSMCAAMADTEIAAYQSGHPFVEAGLKVRTSQPSTPWIYWRPVVGTGNVNSWVDLAGDTFAQAPVQQAKRARLVLYLDPNRGGPPGEYAIYLTHGGSGIQGEAEANYSLIFDDTKPNVILTDDRNDEGFEVVDSDPRHIQIHVTSGASDTGGAVVGYLKADEEWRFRVKARFTGDIQGWDLYNGETGDFVSLQDDEPVIIRNEPLGSINLTPEVGDACNTSERGICANGTIVDCRNGVAMCAQTVFGQSVELCDGVDNTCNGLVDAADPSLSVPMLRQKQGLFSGYQVWPTLDYANFAQAVDYTPAADDRLGVSEWTRPDGTAILGAFKESHVVPMRDLSDGRLSIAFVHGVGGVSPSGLPNREIEMSMGSGFFSNLGDLDVGWYEDRRPGSTNDRVYKDFDWDEREIEWRVENDRGGVTESDAVVFDLARSDDDNRFWFYIDDETEFAGETSYDFILHGGVGPNQNLEGDRALIVRVSPTPIDSAVCGDGGACTAATYQCVAGKLECSTTCAGSLCADLDGDGQDGFDAVTCPSGTDCDDDSDTTYLGAEELCDGRDNDCDGLVDASSSGCASGGNCGPEECGFAISCMCPDGPELPEIPGRECFCGEGLTP